MEKIKNMRDYLIDSYANWMDFWDDEKEVSRLEELSLVAYKLAQELKKEQSK